MKTKQRISIGKWLLQARLETPEQPLELAKRRKRRKAWQRDRLVILAVDHPARRELAAGGEPWAMSDREELLIRCAQVLMQPGVDGILATPDMMEELLLLNEWVVASGGPDFLSEKVLIGSMNRGGLSQTVFELDDFVTAYTAEWIERMNLDGGKLLLRVDPESREVARTLRYCFEALADLAERSLPAFLEPLSVPLATDDMVRLVGVASALGPTSSHRWLKLPMVPDFKRVARATTCPIVLLGGKNPGGPDELVDNVKRCMDAGENVRGLMIGRGVLYPRDGSEPAAVAAQLAAAVHGIETREVIRWDEWKSTHWDG
jgi:hypothetical protein